MLKIYTDTSCHSCRQAIQWLKKNKINYKEINLTTSPITKKELIMFLSLTEDGVEEIIAKQSHSFKKLKINLNTITLNTLFDLIIQYPTLLRRPIITDNLKIQIGYNVDDIRKFLPRNIRKIKLEIAIENLEDYYPPIRHKNTEILPN